MARHWPRRRRDIWQFPTGITDDPVRILEAIGVRPYHHTAHFDAARGWQIAAVDQRGNIYLDCDETTGVIHILR